MLEITIPFSEEFPFPDFSGMGLDIKLLAYVRQELTILGTKNDLKSYLLSPDYDISIGSKIHYPEIFD